MGIGEIDVGEVDGAGGRGRQRVFGDGADVNRPGDGGGVLIAGDVDGHGLGIGAAMSVVTSRYRLASACHSPPGNQSRQPELKDQARLLASPGLAAIEAGNTVSMPSTAALVSPPVVPESTT